MKGDIMLRINGKSFRCECGANVFKKIKPEEEDGKEHFKCNGCEITYTTEKDETPERSGE
jgi:hypothetical protein